MSYATITVPLNSIHIKSVKMKMPRRTWIDKTGEVTTLSDKSNKEG